MRMWKLEPNSGTLKMRSRFGLRLVGKRLLPYQTLRSLGVTSAP